MIRLLTNFRGSLGSPLILAFFAVLFSTASANAGSILITSLTDLGPGIVPNAINNVGQVVGQNASGQAFLWQAGTMTPLGTLGGSQSMANDINDNGVVVGWAYDVAEKQKAFKWNGVMVNLDSGTTTSSAAEAINRNGDIVGWEQNVTYTSTAWYGGVSNGVSLFVGANSKAFGINSRGEVVGVAIDYQGLLFHAGEIGYYWNGKNSGSGSIFSLYWDDPFLDDRYLPYAGINENGTSGGIGISDRYGQTFDRCKVTVGGNTALTETAGAISRGYANEAKGLNNHDYLAGQLGGYAYITRFDGPSYSAKFSPPCLPFSQLTSANDINDNGMVVGVGLIDGVQHGFVAQIMIVPEPSMPVLLTTLLAVAACFWTVTGHGCR